MTKQNFSKLCLALLFGSASFGHVSAQVHAPAKCFDLRMNIYFEEFDATSEWNASYSAALSNPDPTGVDAHTVAMDDAKQINCYSFLYGNDPTVPGSPKLKRKKCWINSPNWRANSSGENYWGDDNNNPAIIVKTGCQRLKLPTTSAPKVPRTSLMPKAVKQ